MVKQADLKEYVENDTELTRAGGQWRGKCPICHGQNESEFVVFPSNTFSCFKCHEGGDIINYIMARDSVDFFTAAEKLADWMNVELKKDAKYVAVKKSVNEHEKKAVLYHKDVKVVLDYLHKERGLSDETIEFFMLGSYKGGVSIPFFDENGRCVGGAIRRFEGKPKYLTNPNEEGVFCKQSFLYNLRGAKELLTNRLYAVEGFFCAMSLYERGFAGVAYNSSRPTKKHLIRIAGLHKRHPEMTLTLVPDRDEAAFSMLPKVRKDILEVAPNLPVEVLTLPDGVKDVNEYFVNGGTTDEFGRLPLESLDLMVLRVELGKCESDSAERKIVESYVKTVHDSMTLLDVAKYLSKRWNVDVTSVKEYLKINQTAENLEDDFKDAERCIMETRQMLNEKAMSYGITALDEGIMGLGRRKDVTFIGGYSSSGKTFLIVQMACDMVVKQRRKVLFFSMEMSAGALYLRVMACLMGKPTSVVGRMILDNSPEIIKFRAALDKYLYVVDKNGLDIKQMDAYVKEAKYRKFDGDLDCIFIDYIQYMRNCSQFDALAETAKGMKPLAKENDIHVVVLSQLNRGSRIWEKPTMADLKGGGDLEASADNILLLWRPGADPSLPPEEKDLKKDIVMLGVGKARNGSKVEEIELKISQSKSRIILPNM